MDHYTSNYQTSQLLVVEITNEPFISAGFGKLLSGRSFEPWYRVCLGKGYLNKCNQLEVCNFEPKSLDRMQMVRRRKFSAENFFCRRAGAFFAETRLKWVLAFRSVLIRTFSKKCNNSIYTFYIQGRDPKKIDFFQEIVLNCGPHPPTATVP